MTFKSCHLILMQGALLSPARPSHDCMTLTPDLDAGCIAAEMVTCMPLFPGKSHLDQLQVRVLHDAFLKVHKIIVILYHILYI